MASFMNMSDQAIAETRAWLMQRAEVVPGIDQAGVLWWEAGVNASHAFYLGVDSEGNLYRGVSGPGCEYEECEDRTCVECVKDSLAGSKTRVKRGEEIYLGR